MANRISVLVSFDGSDEGIKKAIASAERQMERLAVAGQTAGENVNRGLKAIDAGFEQIGRQVEKAKTGLLAFVGANWAIGKGTELVQLADAWNMMAARLKLATAGAQEYATAQKELFAIAQRIGVPLQETTSLYGKLQQSVRMLGGEQKDALTITESVSQALRLSGASAQESRSSLLQFGQALASGLLRGDEFNSVMENSPRLAKALADGLDVPIRRLRKMAEEGQLTSEVIVNALLSQKDKLAGEYAQLPATVSQSFERLRNAFGQWVNQVDTSTGATVKLSNALTALAMNLDTIMKWLTRLAEAGFAVLAYRLIPATITAFQTLQAAAVTAAAATSAAWQTVNMTLSAATAAVGVLRVAFGTLTAFFVGWQVGTWMSEQFQIVREAGILMVAGLLAVFEDLRYKWEVFVAVFTSDTIADATKRHLQRMSEMSGILGQMYADAGKTGDSAKGAMTAAGDAAAEIAKRLEAVRQGTQEAIGRGVEALHGALEKLKSRLGEVESAYNKASQTVTDATNKMAEGYRGLTDIIDIELQRQVEAVRTRYAAELAQLKLNGDATGALITGTTQLLVTALAQETDLRKQATADTLKLIDEEGSARKIAAKRFGDTELERSNNVTRVENDILATKRKALSTAADEYKKHVDLLNTEIYRHLTAIQDIEREKRGIAQSTEDRLREIMRGGMTDWQATQDRKAQIYELQSKARIAIEQKQEGLAKEYAQKALDLALQVTGDEVKARGQVALAIGDVRSSQDLLNKALDVEAGKQKDGAAAAIAARDKIKQTLDDTRTKITDITESLKGGIGVSVYADTIRFEDGLIALQKATAEKKFLVSVKADLDEAREELQKYEQLLKAGKTLPVDANVDKARKALDDLKLYAEKSGQFELQVKTQQAQGAITDVGTRILALEKIQTESRHLVQTNVPAVKAEIQSLNGANTSSTHTIYVNKVEANAAGGLVGSGIARFANGGAVGFPGMAGGAVPGVGNEDTVPRTLDGGAFVLRKAAVAKYGLGNLARLATGVARFAMGGPATSNGPSAGAFDDFIRRITSGEGGPSSSAAKNTPGSDWGRLMANANQIISELIASAVGLPPAYWGDDIRSYLARVLERIRSSRSFEEAKGHWDKFAPDIDSIRTGIKQSQAMHVPMVFWGGGMSGPAGSGDGAPTNKPRDWTDSEWAAFKSADSSWGKQQGAPSAWDLLQRRPVGKADGGAMSDTVPAMLTPGEFVVNRSAVQRYGAGLFAALNAMAVPARSFAQNVRGFAAGGMVPGGYPLARPNPTASSVPSKTIRVELASGGRTIAATVDARDEWGLLQLLDAAKARAT